MEDFGGALTAWGAPCFLAVVCTRGQVMLAPVGLCLFEAMAAGCVPAAFLAPASHTSPKSKREQRLESVWEPFVWSPSRFVPLLWKDADSFSADNLTHKTPTKNVDFFLARPLSIPALLSQMLYLILILTTFCWESWNSIPNGNLKLRWASEPWQAQKLWVYFSQENNAGIFLRRHMLHVPSMLSC